LLVGANLKVAVSLFLLAQTFSLLSGFVMFAMIGEVNRAGPDQQRISYLGGHFAKYRRILNEYRRLYPDGRLSLYFKVSLASGLMLLLGSAWQLGFFR
jgi:hypothetical protein